MKINKMSDATKILIMAASIIITCIIVAVGMSVARNAEKLGKKATVIIVDLDKEISERGLTKYDQVPVTGSEITNLIKEFLGKYEAPSESPIYIEVDGFRYVNDLHIADIRNFTHERYIKPTGRYMCSIVRNQNDVIIGITFIRQ